MIVLVIIFLLGAVAFLFLMPCIFPIDLTTLDPYRNYANIVSSVVSSVVGSTGIILGYFYYKDKLKKDNNKSHAEKMNRRIEELLRLIDKCDEYIERLIYRQVTGDSDLKMLLDQIQKHSESIMIFLENNEILMKISDDKMKSILSWYSYINNSPMVMVKRKKQLTQKMVESERGVYRRKLREARTILICGTQ